MRQDGDALKEAFRLTAHDPKQGEINISSSLRALQKHEVGAWIEFYQQIDDFLEAGVYQQLLGL